MSKLSINFKFGVVPIDLLNNPNMSAKAKGLFGYLQSKPENWDFSVRTIALQMKDSRDSITSGLKELETFGYLERVKKNNEKGYIETEYILHAFPLTEQTVKGKSVKGNSINNSNIVKSNIVKSKKEKENNILFPDSEKPKPKPPQPLDLTIIKGYQGELLDSEMWVAQTCSLFKCTNRELSLLIANYGSYLFSIGELDKGFSEFKRYFVNWARTEINKHPFSGYLRDGQRIQYT